MEQIVGNLIPMISFYYPVSQHPCVIGFYQQYISNMNSISGQGCDLENIMVQNERLHAIPTSQEAEATTAPQDLTRKIVEFRTIQL